MKPTASTAPPAEPRHGALRRNLLLVAGYVALLALIARSWL
jgi:hypothetical protein